MATRRERHVRTRSRRAFLLCVGSFVGSFLLSACASSLTLPTPPRGFRFRDPGTLMRTSIGTRVYVAPDSGTNLVHLATRFRVGARDDGDHPGMAHLVEHLMFRMPGRSRPTLGDEIAAHTLSDNAYTSWDETHYWMQTTAEHLAATFEAATRRMSIDCDAWSEDEFLRAREVVRNELRQRWSPETEVRTQLRAAVYPEGHPYQQPIIGTEESLVAIDRQAACEFAKTYYVPNLATYVVAGNVETQRVANLVETWMSDLEPRDTFLRRKAPAPAIAGRSLELDVPVQRPRVALAFNLPARFDDRYFAGTMMAEELHWRARAMVEEESRAKLAGVRTLGGRDAPVLVVWIEIDDASRARSALRRLQSMVDATTARLANDAWYNERGRQRLRAEVLEAMSDQVSRPFWLMDYVEAGVEYGFHGGDVSRINGLEPRAMSLFAGEIFAADRAMQIVMRPKAQVETPRPPSWRGEVHARARRSSWEGETQDADLEAMSRALDIGPIERRGRWRAIRLANGMRVVLVQSTRLPVLDVLVSVGTGHFDAPAEIPSLATAASRILQADLASPESVVIHNAFGRTGGITYRHVSGDSSQFDYSGLSIYTDYAIAGMANLVTQGAFSHDEVEAFHNRQRKLLRARDGDSIQFPGAPALWRSLWGEDHPRARKFEDAARDLDDIDPKTLTRFKHAHYRAADSIVVVTGGINLDLAETHVQARFGERSIATAATGWNEDVPNAAEAVPGEIESPAERHHLGLADDRSAQLEFRIAVAHETRGAERFVETALLAALIELRFAELRGQRGLTYGVHTELFDARGALMIRGHVDPQRAAEAMTQIAKALDELAELSAEQPPASYGRAFIDARRDLVRDFLSDASGHRSLAQQIAVFVRAGLPPDAHRELAHRASATTWGDLATYARDVFAGERRSILLRGPKPAIEAAYAAIDGPALEWVVSY